MFYLVPVPNIRPPASQPRGEPETCDRIQVKAVPAIETQHNRGMSSNDIIP